MSKTDNSFIYLVSENGRMKIKELSKILKKSSPRLKYNISTMEKDGILGDIYTIFDYSYFGLLLFRVYFKGGYIGDIDKKRIVDELITNPYIIGIYELSGEYDLVVEFAAPNPSRFNKELKKIVSIKSTMNNYKILLNFVSYVYPRNYLTKSEYLQSMHNERLIGGDRERSVFTETEMNIIKVMLENPSARLSTMAKKADINIKTLHKTIESLRKRKIVQGYRRMIDMNKLGISRYRLFLRLHNISKEREHSITEHMLNTTEIVILNKTVGDWDMEIDIETTDKTRARAIIMEIREKFMDLIESFNMMEFYSYYKREYLPAFLFNK